MDHVVTPPAKLRQSRSKFNLPKSLKFSMDIRLTEEPLGLKKCSEIANLSDKSLLTIEFRFLELKVI